MPDLRYRQERIQEKRKQTPFRDFVKEVCSWSPLTYYKNKGFVSIFPETDRLQHIVSVATFAQERDALVIDSDVSYQDFFAALFYVQQSTLFPCVRQF